MQNPYKRIGLMMVVITIGTFLVSFGYELFFIQSPTPKNTNTQVVELPNGVVEDMSETDVAPSDNKLSGTPEYYENELLGYQVTVPDGWFAHFQHSGYTLFTQSVWEPELSHKPRFSISKQSWVDSPYATTTEEWLCDQAFIAGCKFTYPFNREALSSEIIFNKEGLKFHCSVIVEKEDIRRVCVFFQSEAPRSQNSFEKGRILIIKLIPFDTNDDTVQDFNEFLDSIVFNYGIDNN